MRKLSSQQCSELKEQHFCCFNLLACDCDCYFSFCLLYVIWFCNLYLSHDIEICPLYKIIVIKSSIHATCSSVESRKYSG